MTPPSIPKGTPEELWRAQDGPQRAPRASQNHPLSALGEPWRVRKLSWGGFLRLRASFWGPQGLFYRFLPPFPRFSSLFSSLFFSRTRFLSLLSSLFLFATPAARRYSRSELGSAAPLPRSRRLRRIRSRPAQPSSEEAFSFL